MKNKDKYVQFRLGISLVVLSFLVYLLHWIIFRDIHHIVLYLIGDLGFLFIQVLLVTMIIEKFLSERERQVKFQKLNMVIGAFFSEVGTPLLRHFIDFDRHAPELRETLLVDGTWDARRFDKARSVAACFPFDIHAGSEKLELLKPFLIERREMMLRLLENPTLLEHEMFTELLWAVFHLTEELACRNAADTLPDSDLNHLAGDIKRAYPLLIGQWLSYLEHLKRDYPYLYSLAVRLNPFNPQANPQVQG